MHSCSGSDQSVVGVEQNRVESTLRRTVPVRAFRRLEVLFVRARDSDDLVGAQSSRDRHVVLLRLVCRPPQSE